MLKIKDGVDLKELEKFGFKPKYDENTGKIDAYEKINKMYDWCGIKIKPKYKETRFRIFKKTEKQWQINPYREYFDIDMLYDLIKADLIEKV